jgi:hypothetical protein
MEMAHFEAVIEIERPVDAVYDWFLAMDQNAPRIEPRMDDARKEPPGETRPGTKFYFIGRGREVPLTFTDLKQNQWIEFGLKIGPMHPTGRLSFESTASGTRLSIRGQSNLPTLLKPLQPLVHGKAKRDWEGRLDRIRADLEAVS